LLASKCEKCELEGSHLLASIPPVARQTGEQPSRCSRQRRLTVQSNCNPTPTTHLHCASSKANRRTAKLLPAPHTGRSIVAVGTTMPAARFTPHLRVALPFGQVSTGHTLPSGAIATDAKSPCPFPGRRKGARHNPIYNEKPRNCRVTLIATAVPGMGYKGILPKRACRLVFAYFLPKQKVGNPRLSLAREEHRYSVTKYFI